MLQETREESYHINMLVNLLVQFPEIYTITFNIPASSCRLSYMVKRKLGQEEFQALRNKFQEYLEAFYFFHNCEHTCRFKLLKNTYPGLTQIQICLDGKPLDGVISLFSNIVREFFNGDLISEIRRGEDSGLPEAALLVGEISGNYPASDPNRKISQLFAFREAGKVYVFDK